ncbi:MAG: phosphoesterase [Streptosporangiales bacterium]|nr:phosphoesterase [Streptosporangiales bacterium]
MGADAWLRREGCFTPGTPDWAYVPIDVPPGIGVLEVRCAYDRSPGNSLDLGVFDPAGHGPGGAGFRGWSGGARDRFTIAAGHATPGYLPGPITPGRWHVALGPYTVAPHGLSWTLDVRLGAGAGVTPEPCPAPPRAAGRGAAWYRGDLHTHTVHSDGRRTPDELAAAAADAGLDFIASTEHNTPSANLVWGRHTRPGLLVIPGTEATTRDGHMLALGLPPGGWAEWRHRAADGALPGVAAGIRDGGGLAVAAHPHTTCLGCDWRFGYRDVDAVEVWNGPWGEDDEAALRTWDGLLRAGVRRPAVAGSDTHTPEQPVGSPQTVVWAEELSTSAVLAGIRAGRSYLAASRDIGVDLTVRADPAGEAAGPGRVLRLPPDTEVQARVEVGGVPYGEIALHTRDGPRVRSRGDGVVTWRGRAAELGYVRAEIRHAGGMAALTNPVFVEA